MSVKKIKCELPLEELPERLIDFHIKTSDHDTVHTNRYPLYQASSVFRECLMEVVGNEMVMPYKKDTIMMLIGYLNFQYTHQNPFVNITKNIFIEFITLTHQYEIEFDHKLIADEKLREFSLSGEVIVVLLNFKKNDILDDMMRFKQSYNLEFQDLNFLKTPQEVFLLGGGDYINITQLTLNLSQFHTEIASDSAIFLLEKMDLRVNNEDSFRYNILLFRCISQRKINYVLDYVTSCIWHTPIEKPSKKYGLKFTR